MSRCIRRLVLVVALLGFGTAVAADPPISLTDDATAFLYRAQPGDLPGAVAERFGVHDVSAFLAANGISDPTRVATGHVYRIPNPLAERALAAEARVAALSTDADAARTRVRALEAEVAALSATSADLERRSASLARLASLWPWMKLLGLLLVLGIGTAAWVAYRSMHELGQSERYAKQLAGDVDERRRLGLAERQESARRILKLEEEARALQHELAHARRRPTGTH